MPQLNVADFIPQLFWLAVTFITLYVILAKLALPRVAGVLDARAHQIANDLQAAEALKKQADAAKTAYEASLAEARASAAKLIAAAQETAKAQADKRLQEVGERLAADAAAAEARIVKAKEDALAGIRDVATDVSRDIVQKLTGLSVDDAAAKAAVDAELKAQGGSK
jgi:F-type H+-transporting ATPase subunit b